jgi:hypothetical protein
VLAHRLLLLLLFCVPLLHRDVALGLHRVPVLECLHPPLSVGLLALHHPEQPRTAAGMFVS